MKNIWVGTSWKMNKTLVQALEFSEAMKIADDNRDARIQRFVIPPFTMVREVADQLSNTSVKVGAQNMHWSDNGAWTGEVSPLMLNDCNLDIVELGHSERREFFGETDETVGLKVEAAVRHGLIPLICIGESLDAREAGKAQEVLGRQVRGALSKLNAEQKSVEILFAYEPIWAIGESGVPATKEYADDRQKEIKNLAKEILGKETMCLYGGSVNPQNCAELVQCESVDGLFIGRSAWDVKGYLNILALCADAIKGI